MFILSLPGMYNLDIVIITGAFFIIFNLTASIISYLQGYKQARLFIVGFSIVFFSYLLIILDALGLTSIMQDFQNILMFGTAFEALILSLAFADRYVILQNEKEEVDARILIESKERAAIIENEVVKKTDELNHALKTKELLLEEVNHRVKNNLQVILSIIRLQNNEIEDEDVKEKFISLENRINAIAKTYNTLLVKGDLVEIDMQEYIDSLLADIQETLDHEEQQISIKTDIDVMIPLRESVYIGLIINELVSNAYKYAFDDDKGKISISLHHDKDDYLLIVEDNGKGFIQKETNTTLGLKLIHTLIYDQLGGDMKVLSNDHTKYSIRFRI
jgi:two-component sensor histidine kinase